MVKILLDTDIGCDIDDMYALGYLLSRDDTEILGITTVSPEPIVRAELCDNMCKIFGKSVPICVGEENALCGKFVQSGVLKPQRAVLDGYTREVTFSENAARFMKDIIEKNPGEIVLCAIGPLTNVAKLFTEYPETIKLIKNLIIMGGRFGEVDTQRWGVDEWNIINDIPAAKIVFEADADATVVGVETTCRCFVTGSEAHEIFSGCPVLLPATQGAREWKEVHFHDAVAIATYYTDEFATFKRGKVTVTDKGETVFTPDENGNHTLMTDICSEKFMEHFKKTVGVE